MCLRLYVCPGGFVDMLNRNQNFFGQYGWGPLEMAEGPGSLGNHHPAPRLLRPCVSLLVKEALCSPFLRLVIENTRQDHDECSPPIRAIQKLCHHQIILQSVSSAFICHHVESSIFHQMIFQYPIYYSTTGGNDF